MKTRMTAFLLLAHVVVAGDPPVDPSDAGRTAVPPSGPSVPPSASPTTPSAEERQRLSLAQKRPSGHSRAAPHNTSPSPGVGVQPPSPMAATTPSPRTRTDSRMRSEVLMAAGNAAPVPA